MKSSVDSEVVERCILEHLVEPRYARSGCQLRTLEEVMVYDRGIDRKEFDAALRKLGLEEKTVKPRGRDWPSARLPWSPEDVLELTPKGKERLRHLRATAQFNMRMPERVLEELGSLVTRNESVSQLALELIEEGLRMRKFPGIDFRTTRTGRKPHVIGTGLSVWELFHIWKDHGESVERLLKGYPHLNASQINAGVAYAKEFLHEMPVGGWGEKPPFAREFKV